MADETSQADAGVRPAHTHVKILVTDLDGTLLGGDEDGRRRLRQALDQHPEITVVFATGRGLPSVRTLLDRDLLVPSPRWIIADVGASVVDATDMSHVDVLEAQLRAGWPGHDHVRTALSGHFPQLGYQEEVAQDGRCSYYLSPQHLTERLKSAVEELGCSWSYSEDRFFDVLPPQAGKGPAVQQLARKLQWPASRILVAGDSLNDLSMFRLGTHGVIVGNAEPGLSAQAPTNARVHRTSRHGASGVLAALERLGWLRTPSPVVIAYHRPPVRWSRGHWHRPLSPNGILPALTSALTDENAPASAAVWAAALVHDRPASVPEPPAGLPMALLTVPFQRWAGYFHGACKETLWPALMSQPQLIRHTAPQWAAYEAFNEDFAQHISAHAQHGGTVWLHDYNLWLVPGILRSQRPDLRIGLFHHTPFPAPDTFRQLPVAEQLRDSLRKLDWVGFHTATAARNFQNLLSEDPDRADHYDRSDHADRADHLPRIGVHPLGIDRQAVAAIARSRPPHTPAPDDGSVLVLSVERLDYAKAPVQKICALAALLEQSPELRGRLRFRLICPPPEPGIHAYDTTRDALEAAIGRLNSRWGTEGWSPVDYRPQSLPFPEVVDHYLAADVFWVTSLADGMNLTAQEYIAAKSATGLAGTLVLSGQAGAAEHFGTVALLTDPHSPQDLVDTLRQALDMPPAQRQTHIARLAALLTTPSPADWARTIIAAIQQAGGPQQGALG
ncbi:HAD-IIB family hydrolase [Streptomyces sp. NPDC001793]|uniref:HAD-IIB family hydrolase n=1 Tax=Streptomyces sp. NPDC001793 TaxID=3154657 RepID=UPI00331B5FB0